MQGDTVYRRGKKKEILDRIETRLNKMDTLKAEEAAATARGHVHVAANKAAEIDKGFNYVIGQLEDLFEGGDYGTEKDPIPIDWPGPQSSEYRTLYFGGYLPVTSRPKPQSVMKAIHSKGQNDETGTPIKMYLPHNRTNLANGGQIGITPEFQIYVGKKVGPLTQETTTGGEVLENLIKYYGYQSTQDDLELDHVHEIQFGGIAKNNVLGNLWPLKAGRNSSKGPTLASATVEYPRGHQINIPTLKLIRNDDVKAGKKFFFIVNSVGPSDKKP
jgi:hypothetical protein